MKTIIITLLAVVVSVAAEAGGPATAVIGDLGWMAGHWRLEQGTTVVEEGWLGPSGGTMLGVNRTVAEERTAGFEFLRFAERDGGVVLFASPGGRCPASEFVLIELDGSSAVFENPDHDFPQRISYRREGDRLHAEISGVENGENKKAGWVFERVP